MKLAVRFALCLLTLAGLTFAAPTPTAQASTADLEFHDCAFTKGLGNGECQHFLRNPAGPTDDPCWCDKCRNGATNQRHDGHTIPPGWNATLFEIGGLDAYLKRHSVAWGITCSVCLASEKPWPDGGGGNTGMAPAKDWAGRPARDTVMSRIAVERRLFRKGEEVVLAYSRHFYFATDIDGLKAKTTSGGTRPITRHEWVHLMIERAEFARREFTRNLGPLMTETQKPNIKDPIPNVPIAIFFSEKESDFERISAAYFKAPGNKGLRGAGAEMCGGMCLSGFGWSKEKLPDDHEMAAYMRHRLGHHLLSLWGSWQTRPKATPVWMDEGLAHWLTKSTEKFRNDAAWCAGEAAQGGAPSYGETGWDKEVAKWAASAGRLGSIEELLGKTVINELSEEDQKRSWSYFDFCLTEWRQPFVKMLADLRQEKDVREAFEKNLGVTPEVFDERWRDRLAGRRKTMAPTAADEETEGNETPGSRDRRAIRSEQDPTILAYKLRQLGEIKDKKTIPVVVDVIAQNLDLPRETALVALLKVKDPDGRDVIWNYGLSHPNGVVRAYVARVCGRLGLSAALAKLEAQLTDTNWYARAEAAVACGMLKDVKAMSAMRKMVESDPSDKARIGAMDALAMFREDAIGAVPAIGKALDDAQWQVRVAAAQALGELGLMEAIEPLIARFEKEAGGRIGDEIYEALKKVSRDDLGRKWTNWRKWWEVTKANNTRGGLPGRPAEPQKPKGPDPNDPRATRDSLPAPYFGVELYSNRVAFICDTSESMLTLFTPDPESAKALDMQFSGRDKLTICKEEVARSLSKLDPRAHFNLVTFGTAIRAFNTNPVSASSGNVESAVAWLRNVPGAGETNYYDALKAALDLGDAPDTNANLKATPDVITFLTDGHPTKGDIKDADVLIEWYTGLNRYARVKTHTITFGLVGVDMALLKGIAERNWGKFVHVRELKKPKR